MSRPNILIVMTDQQQAGSFPLDWQGRKPQPQLYSFFESGVGFTDAYTASPLCAPARISFLTGRFPSAHGVRENFGLESAVREKDLFDVARDLEYATALIGKNHTYLAPNDVDEFIEYDHLGRVSEEGSTSDFDAWLRNLGFRTHLEPTPFPPEDQLPHRIVDDAIVWVESVRDRPFCLWLSIPEPHVPYQVPEPYYSLFPPESLPPPVAQASAVETKSFKWRYVMEMTERAFPSHEQEIGRARANYYGMLRLIDDEVARLLARLRKDGRLEDTLVIYLADHGDFAGEYGLMRKGPELPEALVRIPLAIAGPGVKPRGGSSRAMVSLVDLLPTLCEALEVEIPRGAQGRSLWPLLAGQEITDDDFSSIYAEQGVGGEHYAAEDVVDRQPGLSVNAAGRAAFDTLNACTQSGSLRMVRVGDWKLVLDMNGDGQLYDLANDPGETDDRWGDPNHADVRSTLLRALATWLIRVADPLPMPPDGYPRKRAAHNLWSTHYERGT